MSLCNNWQFIIQKNLKTYFRIYLYEILVLLTLIRCSIRIIPGEIYKTVISIYSNEEDSPLPQADEVLLCTPYTTLDMVCIINFVFYFHFWNMIFPPFASYFLNGWSAHVCFSSAETDLFSVSIYKSRMPYRWCYQI